MAAKMIRDLVLMAIYKTPDGELVCASSPGLFVTRPSALQPESVPGKNNEIYPRHRYKRRKDGTLWKIETDHPTYRTSVTAWTVDQLVKTVSVATHCDWCGTTSFTKPQHTRLCPGPAREAAAKKAAKKVTKKRSESLEMVSERHSRCAAY